MTKRTWTIIAGAILLVLLVAAGGLAWKLTSDAAATAAAEEQAKRESERIAASQRAAEEREEAAVKAEQARRTLAVDGIEASVKTMAEGHANEGLIDGPIIDVTCSPVEGGSLEDIAEQTTAFECFVANKDNGDGTMSGYNYHATMNWTTGSYTYGLGAP